VNVTGERRAGEWRFGWAPSEVRLSRLD
jgi:hypothetical protein